VWPLFAESAVPLFHDNAAKWLLYPQEEVAVWPQEGVEKGKLMY